MGGLSTGGPFGVWGVVCGHAQVCVLVARRQRDLVRLSKRAGVEVGLRRGMATIGDPVDGRFGAPPAPVETRLLAIELVHLLGCQRPLPHRWRQIGGVPTCHRCGQPFGNERVVEGVAVGGGGPPAGRRPYEDDAPLGCCLQATRGGRRLRASRLPPSARCPPRALVRPRALHAPRRPRRTGGHRTFLPLPVVDVVAAAGEAPVVVCVPRGSETTPSSCTRASSGSTIVSSLTYSRLSKRASRASSPRPAPQPWQVSIPPPCSAGIRCLGASRGRTGPAGRGAPPRAPPRCPRRRRRPWGPGS